MKTQHLFLGLALVAAISVTSCKKESAALNAPLNTQAGEINTTGMQRVEVNAPITTNTTWTKDKIYVLDGIIYVGDGSSYNNKTNINKGIES